VLGDEVYSKFPFQPGMRPMAKDPVELILNRTWRPFLSVTGADGIPLPKDGGNVLRPFTTLKLSMRTPPTVDATAAGKKMKEVLERDPPDGAKVNFDVREGGANGWSAPPLSPWLEKSIQDASQAHYGKPAIYMGEGGTIPFMAMLGAKFPRAQFMITGVLGPGSNAHGPNEFLDISYGKKLTACVARVLADHSRQG
jgi:acetylornithine deacetylase/succinyl-diaminopimelate desuccinylase-like protein